jgi:hypothetical protein
MNEDLQQEAAGVLVLGTKTPVAPVCCEPFIWFVAALRQTDNRYDISHMPRSVCEVYR